MKKQVRKILSALLVLTMLLSTLPAAVYAEAGDVEPIATPTVEPIEESIVETIATPVPEATEEPTEEPIIEVTAEPAGEPAAEPVVEPAVEPAAMPAAPAELTDAQQAALHALPDGFSAQVVAAAMLSSNNCAHTVFHIQVTWAEEAYTRIDDENHRYTGKITQKKLVCGNCGATLQTISVNEVYDEVYGHDWVMDIDSTSPYDFVCSSCGAKKRFTSACSHTNVYQGEDGNLHCKDCGAITYVFEKNECEHKNITIIQPDTVLTLYDQWDAETHVKYTSIWHYDDTSYVDAECDDCGISIICDRNGNNRSYGTTDTAGNYTNEKSTLEAHSFENGVCAQCGYVQSETDPDTCDHSAGNYNDVLDADIAPVYSNITAESHCVQYSYKRYCKDCNAYIGNVTDEGITPVPHDFGTGDTCACGYKKAETPEDAPYVRGFTMSASKIQVGQVVTFTLDIANAKAGDVLNLEFCADTGKYKEEFTLTYPDNVFTHEFSQDGNRSIRFRVMGGEYCAAQTLIVEASKAGIDSAKLSLSNLSVVEKAEGETIHATITCNNQTGVAELYVGNKENYAFSVDYDVVDGRRVFEVEVTLGGNGKSYAGDYKIWVNALKGAYQAVDATYNLGTLKVTHTYTTQSEPAGSYYEKSANGHTLYNKTKITETCSVCGDQKETTQKKPAGNEEPHVGLTENGKCSVCGYAKGKLKINEDVVIGENGRMKIATPRVITTPHYYLDAGTISGNPEDLVRVIRQFDVMNNYKPVKVSDNKWDTFCNFFASNVARAMGAYMPGPGDLICQNCYGIVRISNDYTGWNEIVDQKDLRCSCGARLSVSVAFPVGNKTSWEQVGHSVATDGNRYGDLTRWFIEKSEDFGWEAINDYTVENYANITDNTPSLRADTIDKAKEYANKGYLVIGVRSDWIYSSKNNQQSGHIFVVHPNSDTSKLYTVQAGGQSAMRENRPDGNGTRSSDNGWNAFFVFTGKDL